MKVSFSRKNLWEKAPPVVKAVVGRGLSAVPLSWLLGRRFRAQRRFLRQADRWSAEQAGAYQLQRLREICRLAEDGSSFYRAHFAAAGFRAGDLHDLGNLDRLPTIDRDTVIANAEAMCALPPAGRDVDFVSTGGTSGRPLRFWQQAGRSAVEYAFLVTSWQRAGFSLGMPMAVLRGRVVEPDRRGLRHQYDPLLRHHYYSAFHLTDENIARYLDHIATIGPCFLHVYPSSAAALGRFCRRHDRRPPGNIRGIIAESEIVYPEQRRLVEEVFGCRYFSCYGHTEKLVMAAECEHSQDYHVWPAYGHFELLDEQGRTVATPGQRGEIVATGFMNAVMPFIRYRTGDWATYVGDRCEGCGRQQPIIREIRGHRTQESLIASDGAAISWTALNMHDDTFDRVRQFQFRQDQPGRAVLRLVTADGFDDACRKRIQSNLGRKFDGRLSFTIELAPSIPLSSRGKAIYVDQRIGKPANGLPAEQSGEG